MMQALRTSYLGPATVTQVEREALTVRLETAAGGVGPCVSAKWAVAFPYSVKRHDRLLVLGKGQRFLAIGVLAGRGVTPLSCAAGLQIEAGKRLRLLGRRGVTVRGTSVTVSGWRRVVREALRVQSRAATLLQHYRDHVDTRVGNRDDAAWQDWQHRARSLLLTVQEVVQVNGRNIRVG